MNSGYRKIRAGDPNWDELSDDLTPQLGGNLDVNGQSIVSTSGGDIAITPDTTGSVILDGLSWPQADGTNGYVLTTDGAGNLSWAPDAGGGMSDVVDDTTPQLGGNLDVNGFQIVSVSNGNIQFVPNSKVLNKQEYSGIISVPLADITMSKPESEIAFPPNHIEVSPELAEGVQCTPNEVAELLYKVKPEIFSRFGDDYVMDAITQACEQHQGSAQEVAHVVVDILKQGISEAYDHNAPFNAADFNRHMAQLRAREELRKTDPMKALVGDLIDKEHDKERLAKRKPQDDDSMSISDPRHPQYAYTQAGHQGVAEGMEQDDPMAKSLGKFAYYAITAKGEDEPQNPYPAGTKSHADFEEGYDYAYSEQSRRYLAAPVENLARLYNVGDRLHLLKQGVAEGSPEDYIDEK